MSSRRRPAVVAGLAAVVVATVGIVALAVLRSSDEQDVVLAEPTPTPATTPTEAGDDGEERSPRPEPSPAPSPDETAPEVACEPPELRPGVLPWLDEGEEVPGPDVVHAGEDSAYVAWLGDGDAAAGPDVSWEGPVVSLTAVRSPDWEPGTNDHFGQVDVRGRAGEVVWVGDPGVGQLSVRWREAEGECGVYSLSALTRGDWSPSLGAPFQPGERCADPAEEDFDECYDAFVEAMEATLVSVAQSLATAP